MHTLDLIYKNTTHADLPVRVNAAVALIKLLCHEIAVNFVRPGLGSVIKIYLKLIDEIDYDELIESLKVIVEIFNDEIQPYAEELCVRLGESFCRLMEINHTGEEHLELDNETSLTADGLMTAIRRILQSISGRFPHIFPRLEQILTQPIQISINDPNGTSVEEGLTCLAILLYNQQQISQNMWSFFSQLVASILSDQGLYDNYLNTVFVVLINFLNKAPEQTKQIEFPGMQGVTCLQTMCQLIAKTFELSSVYEDEIIALQAVTLANAILENVKGVSGAILPGILDLYLQQMQSTETQDLELMILQGIMTALWYDAPATIAHLESRQATAHICQ